MIHFPEWVRVSKCATMTNSHISIRGSKTGSPHGSVKHYITTSARKIYPNRASSGRMFPSIVPMREPKC